MTDPAPRKRRIFILAARIVAALFLAAAVAVLALGLPNSLYNAPILVLFALWTLIMILPMEWVRKTPAARLAELARSRDEADDYEGERAALLEELKRYPLPQRRDGWLTAAGYIGIATGMAVSLAILIYWLVTRTVAVMNGLQVLFIFGLMLSNAGSILHKYPRRRCYHRPALQFLRDQKLISDGEYDDLI